MDKQTIENALTAFPGDWNSALAGEKTKDYFRRLIDQVSDSYLRETVYPPFDQVFHALEATPLNQVKVVIIGQDPYFNPGQANGMAFSVGAGTRLPPSLVNIYKELFYEYGYPVPKTNGSLEPWARQGVLLLNATLTVKGGQALSHSQWGWQTFTDEIIRTIDKEERPIVYLLWGNYAKEKANLISNKKACIIKTAHPSPMSATRGFFCSDCFKRANTFLTENKLDPIAWQIKD